MLAIPGHLGGGLIAAGLTGLNSWIIILGAIIPDLDAVPYLFGVPYRKTHRTITHSIFMPLLTALISLPLAIGVLSHLILDFLFYPGIKLFYPFSQREFYVYKGGLEKHLTPEAFLKSVTKKSKYLVVETVVLVLGLLVFNNIL